MNLKHVSYVTNSMNRLASGRTQLGHICKALLILLVMSRSRKLTAQNPCGVRPSGSNYSYVKGDESDSRHLQLTRSLNMKGTLQVTICAGTVRILPSKDSQVHLSVELGRISTVDTTAFVRKIEAHDDSAFISLSYPKELHPFIVLRMPPGDPLHTAIKLGTGELSVRGDAIHADRQFSVGVGKLTIYLRGDEEYSTLEANVALGSFHDRRPGGWSDH